MIGTLLIANRGEIAVRVIRSARARGLRTVAVYSEADRHAPHVRAADVAVHLGPTPATASYLNIEALLDAARSTSADAVHPGYGFLSERAEFARAVTEAGLTFVGPGAEVMERMGRKDHAREVAVAAGVPVVPRDADAFPVLVKAAAGGGGKGMRIVRSAAELDDAVAAAKREALSAFGDDTILLERYVERGRHVEVQVFGDEHGNVVHLFERDCSAQRRHQKVLEEAPAPNLGADARRTLLESAVALTREVGYVNAGTVEFLVAGDPGEEEVFFLEMNTRLQVEHPVTESVIRVGGRTLDLVDLQLRIAAGEPLGFGQDEVAVVGHGIEARVYAEDAFGGFLPQAGTASYVRWPAGARVDAALESGAEVSTAYDPMLGKVIAAGPDREGARRALVRALDDTAILGLTTNVGFVRALAASDAFRDGEVDTAWLDRNPVPAPAKELPAVFAAWATANPRTSGEGVAGAAASLDVRSAFGTYDGWRSAGPSAPVRVVLDDETFEVRPDAVGAHDVRPVHADGPLLRLEVDGLVEEATVLVGSTSTEVAHRGQRFVFRRPEGATGRRAAASDGTVLAPMPGTVLSIDVQPGDAVEEGQVLGVVEAMKMELPLTAPYAGTVRAVGAEPGRQVSLGAVLFEVDP